MLSAGRRSYNFRLCRRWLKGKRSSESVTFILLSLGSTGRKGANHTQGPRLWLGESSDESSCCSCEGSTEATSRLTAPFKGAKRVCALSLSLFLFLSLSLPLSSPANLIQHLPRPKCGQVSLYLPTRPIVFLSLALSIGTCVPDQSSAPAKEKRKGERDIFPWPLGHPKTCWVPNSHCQLHWKCLHWEKNKLLKPRLLFLPLALSLTAVNTFPPSGQMRSLWSKLLHSSPQNASSSFSTGQRAVEKKPGVFSLSLSSSSFSGTMNKRKEGKEWKKKRKMMRGNNFQVPGMDGPKERKKKIDWTTWTWQMMWASGEKVFTFHSLQVKCWQKYNSLTGVHICAFRLTKHWPCNRWIILHFKQE